MLIRLYTILALALVACGSAATPVLNHGNMGFYSSPAIIIEKLENIKKDAASYFMLALAYKEQNQSKKALLNFANSCFVSYRNEKLTLYPMPVYNHVTSFKKKSEYYDDALYEIALIMYSYNEHEYAEKFLKKIGHDKRGLYFESRILLSRAQQGQKLFSEAEKTLSDELDRTRNNSMTSKLLIRRASLYESMNEYDKAAVDYNNILDKDETSWQAGIAASQMYQLVSQNRIQADTDVLHNLAKGLHQAKKYSDAFAILELLNKNSSAKREVLLENFVRTLVRLNRRNDASKLVENSYTPPLRGRYIMADELWLAGSKDAALTIYQNILKGLTGHERELALYRIAARLSDRNRKGYAVYLEQYVREFPKSENAAQLTWLLARSYIEKNRKKDAEIIMKQYLVNFPDGRYSDQCRFWLNKFYAQRGEKNAAAQMAFQLTRYNPDSPYTFLLLERESETLSSAEVKALYKKASDAEQSLYYHSLLFVKDKDKSGRNERISDLDETFTNDRTRIEALLKAVDAEHYNEKQFKFIKNYMAIAYMDGIERITATLENSEAINIENAAVLAYMGDKYKYALYSVYYGQQLLKAISAKENIFTLPDKFIKFVLPTPFENEVKQNAAHYKVDINAIYSLMKAESLFNHKVRSSAGAVGLMQLMPATAKEIARKAKIEKYDLRNPADSIHFGANYLGWLKTYYKNNFVYMVAGYNAGAGNANKWIKKMPDKDEDYFTEFVAFQETRYYILRTGKFLRQYNIIYGP